MRISNLSSQFYLCPSSNGLAPAWAARWWEARAAAGGWPSSYNNYNNYNNYHHQPTRTPPKINIDSEPQLLHLEQMGSARHQSRWPGALQWQDKTAQTLTGSWQRKMHFISMDNILGASPFYNWHFLLLTTPEVGSLMKCAELSSKLHFI